MAPTLTSWAQRQMIGARVRAELASRQIVERLDHAFALVAKVCGSSMEIIQVGAIDDFIARSFLLLLLEMGSIPCF